MPKYINASSLYYTTTMLCQYGCSSPPDLVSLQPNLSLANYKKKIKKKYSVNIMICILASC